MHTAFSNSLKSAGLMTTLLTVSWLSSSNPAVAMEAVSASEAEPAPPDLIELQDGNSVLRTDVLNFNINERWFVDGVNTLFTDLYFFNVGNNPAQRELRLEDFDHIALEQPAKNQLSFTGRSSIFGASLNFSLDTTLYGGEAGSFESRREDFLAISFTGSQPLPFTLYSYIDYDLGLDSNYENDMLSFSGNTLTQTDSSGLRATLTAVNRTPSAVAFDEYPFLIARLYDNNRTNLGQKPSSLAMVRGEPDPHLSQNLGEIDATAALQFDETIQPGQTLTFNFVKQIEKDNTPAAIPEPTLLLGLGVVLGGMAWLRR
jgi:hypothetical protein